MARIWMSGIEAGHLDVFESWHLSAAVVVTPVRTGSYAVAILEDARYVGGVFAASKSEIFGRFAFNPTYGKVSAQGLLVLYDSAGDEQITLLLNSYTCAVYVTRGDYTGAIIGTGGIIPSNRWSCIEFRLVVDNAAGVLQLKVDGTQVINFSGDTQATGNANVLSFRFGKTGAIGAGLPSRGYYDDIAFNDSLGGINDSWIGRGGIQAIFPEGAGTYTQLTANVGPNWDDVDERPPDEDTTYVYHDIINREDSYATEDLVNTGTISAVQWLARARSDFVGVPEIARLLRIGGVDHSGADIAIDADYDYYPEILDEDPQAGPGPWLVAAINGMEIGVTVR